MSENVAKLIDALQNNDMGAANKIFQDDIAARMSTALEAEKVGVAGSVFGSEDEIESDVADEEWEAASEEDLEFELEDSDEDYEELDLPEEE